jgi:hypothetical protein
MFRPDTAACLSERDHPLNLIAQLPHISRPPVFRKQLERLCGEKYVRLSETLRRFAQEEAREMRNFLAAVAQGGHDDTDDGEAVVEILAKLSFRHALFEFVCELGHRV